MQTAFDPVAFEAEALTLGALSTRELIARTWDTTNPDSLALELACRLERYAEELDAREAVARATSGRPGKRPGKVVDLRTRPACTNPHVVLDVGHLQKRHFSSRGSNDTVSATAPAFTRVSRRTPPSVPLTPRTRAGCAPISR